MSGCGNDMGKITFIALTFDVPINAIGLLRTARFPSQRLFRLCPEHVWGFNLQRLSKCPAPRLLPQRTRPWLQALWLKGRRTLAKSTFCEYIVKRWGACTVYVFVCVWLNNSHLFPPTFLLGPVLLVCSGQQNKQASLGQLEEDVDDGEHEERPDDFWWETQLHNGGGQLDVLAARFHGDGPPGSEENNHY